MNTSATKQTQGTTSSTPWAAQTPYLTDAFGKAQTQSNNSYTGNTVSQFTPDQLATFQKMVGAGNSPMGQSIGSTADSLMGGGANAATGALQRLGAFTPQGGTQSNIDAANQYADAAASPAAVDAAMRDARRSVSEQALPQIARSSAMSGNAMSSRTGIAQGIVERGLADKTADTSATMRSNAFGSGLQLAEANSQANNNNMLDAMKSQAGLGTNAAGTGIAGGSTSVDTISKLLGLSSQGGSGEQAAGQAGIDNSMGMDANAWSNLQKYFGVVGGQNWGGTGTSSGTETSTPSIWSTIGGLMSAGGSLMKSDRRVKRNINQIGTTTYGLPLYRYQYVDRPEWHIGLIAQDLEASRPEAVTTIDGIKHVDYALALSAP